MRTPSRRTGSRGQTTLDFAIAMGLFLLAVAFTFSMVPALTAPFVDDHQDGSVAADRIASHLSEGALGDPNEPFVVNESCATPFFADSAPPTHCGYSGSGYEQRVGVTDRISLRVEVIHVNTTATGDDRFRDVCTNSSGIVVHEERAGSSCGTVYRVGDVPSPGDSVTVARRIVTIPGCDFGTESCDATLRVEVW